MEEILDIFNDKLEIIGQDTRKNVHRKGLLHQVVHCVFKQNISYLHHRLFLC